MVHGAAVLLCAASGPTCLVSTAAPGLSSCWCFSLCGSPRANGICWRVQLCQGPVQQRAAVQAGDTGCQGCPVSVTVAASMLAGSAVALWPQQALSSQLGQQVGTTAARHPPLPAVPSQVERYLGNLLPTAYWVGASRSGVGTEYTLTDGSQISQVGLAEVLSRQCCMLIPTWLACPRLILPWPQPLVGQSRIPQLIDQVFAACACTRHLRTQPAHATWCDV